MPEDFVVFCSERKSVFRFTRLSEDNWDKLIRRECRWEFHDNVGEQSAREAFECESNEVFGKHGALVGD